MLVYCTSNLESNLNDRNANLGVMSDCQSNSLIALNAINSLGKFQGPIDDNSSGDPEKVLPKASLLISAMDFHRIARKLSPDWRC